MQESGGANEEMLVKGTNFQLCVSSGDLRNSTMTVVNNTIYSKVAIKIER